MCVMYVCCVIIRCVRLWHLVMVDWLNDECMVYIFFSFLKFSSKFMLVLFRMMLCMFGLNWWRISEFMLLQYDSLMRFRLCRMSLDGMSDRFWQNRWSDVMDG